MEATYFQILDINNVVLRSGVLETTTEITRAAGDWKIRLLTDAGEIVSEQYFAGLQEEYAPRYFIFSVLADKVDLYIGSYYDGYDNVEFFKTGIDGAYATAKLDGCQLTLPLDAGRYTVKCSKENGAWFTFPLRVYTETAQELGEKILGTVSAPTAGQISDIEQLSEYDTVFSKLLANHKLRQNIESFKLLAGYLDIENIRIANLNKHTGITIDVQETSGQTLFNKNLDALVIDQYLNDSWIPCRVLRSVQSTQLPEDALYRITAIEDDLFIAAQAYCYIPNTAIKKELWQDCISAADSQEEMFAALTTKLANYVELTEDEAQYMYIEEINTPSSPAAAKPIVEYNDGDLTVELANSDLSTVLPNGLYAVVQEVDLAFSGGCRRRKPLEAGLAVFEAGKDFLSEEEIYAVWLEDASGKTVSLLSFTDSEGYMASYNDNMRRRRLSEMKTSITAYAKKRGSSDTEALRAILDYAHSLEEIDADSIHDYLTARSISNPYISQMHKTLQLLREHYSRDRLDAAFFEAVYYEKETDQLVFPPLPDRPYILRVTRFSTPEQVIEDTYYASGAGAIEIDCGDSEYKIIQAIDQQTFELSGFLFVCQAAKQKAMNAWKINLEVLPSWQ